MGQLKSSGTHRIPGECADDLRVDLACALPARRELGDDIISATTKHALSSLPGLRKFRTIRPHQVCTPTATTGRHGCPPPQDPQELTLSAYSKGEALLLLSRWTTHERAHRKTTMCSSLDHRREQSHGIPSHACNSHERGGKAGIDRRENRVLTLWQAS